jgi:ribosomal protein S27AE
MWLTMTAEDTNTQSKRFCSRCSSDKTFPNWHKDKEFAGFMCGKCYTRFVTNPKWKHIKYESQFNFRGKSHVSEQPIRIGVCNWCRAVKGQINAQCNKICNRTHRHHESYHEDDLLKDSIEICNKCHNIPSRVGKIRDMSSRICQSCKSSKSQPRIRGGRPHWYRGSSEDQFLCMKCYTRIRVSGRVGA